MNNATFAYFARKYFASSWASNGQNFMKRIYTTLRRWEFGDLLNGLSYPSEDAVSLAEDIKYACNDEGCGLNLAEDSTVQDYELNLKLRNGIMTIKYTEPKPGFGSKASGEATISVDMDAVNLTNADKKKLQSFCQNSKGQDVNFFRDCPTTADAARRIRGAISTLGGILESE